MSSRGIGYLDGDSLKYLKFGDFSFSGHNISSVKINGHEWLLTSFNTGLIWIDSKGAVTTIYDTLGYPGIGAFITYQDRYGSFFWVASTNGLFYFNGTTFIKIKDHHAYLNTSFFEIVDDLQGSLWAYFK